MLSLFTVAADYKVTPLNTLKTVGLGPFSGRVGIAPGISRDGRGLDGLFEASGAYTPNGTLACTHVECGPCTMERQVGAYQS